MARKALLVGLNRYPNPQDTLRGCINDIRQVGDLLASRFGFTADGSVRRLTDERATTGAIVGGLQWLLDGARPGDVLVFHYSGHGSQVLDRNGDELTDGLDEIICPYDLDWNHPLTDDDLGALVGVIQPGVNLTVVLDCCHSGTGLRETAPGPRRSRTRYLPPPMDAARARGRLAVRRFGARAAERGAVLIAGCRENQTSADAYIDGDYHGALTYYLCRTIEESLAELTCRDLLERVRRTLVRHGFAQVPQLEGPAAWLRGAVFAPRAAEGRQRLRFG